MERLVANPIRHRAVHQHSLVGEGIDEGGDFTLGNFAKIGERFDVEAFDAAAFFELARAIIERPPYRDGISGLGASLLGNHKAGATIAANNGATSRQLMSVFGWDTIKEAERYTRAADQQRLAESAMHMIDIADRGNGSA
jgi:hypothetical protein